MSQKTIFKLFFNIASAVDIHVFTGTITSEPSFKFNELTAISNASVPFARLTAYLEPVYFANALSKFSTSYPPTNFEFFIN